MLLRQGSNALTAIFTCIAGCLISSFLLVALFLSKVFLEIEFLVTIGKRNETLNWRICAHTILVEQEDLTELIKDDSANSDVTYPTPTFEINI
mmetsp:Transcript_1072/g.2478  ORF Transcript_1072/g.2478 Transcript_1072/m.2478 type:complete len:93 (+) Transcript_1072:1060-1338(+)